MGGVVKAVVGIAAGAFLGPALGLGVVGSSALGGAVSGFLGGGGLKGALKGGLLGAAGGAVGQAFGGGSGGGIFGGGGGEAAGGAASGGGLFGGEGGSLFGNAPAAAGSAAEFANFGSVPFESISAGGIQGTGIAGALSNIAGAGTVTGGEAAAGGTVAGGGRNLLGSLAKAGISAYQQQSQQEAINQAAEAANPYNQYRAGDAASLANLQATGSAAGTGGYEFVKAESLREGQRQLAAQGKTKSGQMVAEMQKRAAGLASQQYAAEHGRLATLSGAGQGYQTPITAAKANIQSEDDLYGNLGYISQGQFG